MSSTSGTQSTEYDLVSSFYGPGAVGGWYLTALACLVSFSLHPRKRSYDSITADLIAVLTFPTVAAVDLITQARSFPKEGFTLEQNAASIEAALLVTEKFLAIDMVIFYWILRFKCVRRACLLTTMGLFCLSVECYVLLSFSDRTPLCYKCFKIRKIEFEEEVEIKFHMWEGKVSISDGKDVSSDGKVLISVMAVLVVCIIWVLSPIAVFFSGFIPEPHARPSERDVAATRKNDERDYKRRISANALTIIIWFFLPCFCVATMFPLSSNVFIWFDGKVTGWVEGAIWERTTASRTAHDLIPKSNTSVKELDQAVAILAGASVLGFSLYSTADTYYKPRLSKPCAIAQQRGTELTPLNRNLASSH